MYANWGKAWEKEQTINSLMVSLNVSAYLNLYKSYHYICWHHSTAKNKNKKQRMLKQIVIAATTYHDCVAKERT